MMENNFSMHTERVKKMNKKELETLTARLLSVKGFDVETNVWVRGKFKRHYEIDIYAEKPKWLGLRRGYSMIVECKAAKEKIESDIVRKYALIFEDISRRIRIDRFLVVTNSTFTDEAKRYADSMNISLMDCHELTKQLMEYRLLGG